MACRTASSRSKSHDVKDADALGNEPLFDAKGTLVGRADGRLLWSRLGKSLGLGYVKPEFRERRRRTANQILGERKRAHGSRRLSPYDPENRNFGPKIL